VAQAGADFIVFLDDDSYPQPGSVDRMLEHFEDEPRLGAAGFRVHLPDGREECSAFPEVFIGCGVGLRAGALGEVGGLDQSLFMQAEEYDLSFRLINAGWTVRTFPDLHVDHLKTACARRSSRTVYYDTRNNLLIAARYLPDAAYSLYARDWLQRYVWLATRDRRLAAFSRGALAGCLAAARDRRRFADRRLTPEAFETLFRWQEVAGRIECLAAAGVGRVVFADLGKNVLAFHLGAAQAGLAVLAIGDDRFARSGRRYRDVPVVPLARALALEPDAVVVSNTSPVHAAETAAALARTTGCPVHCWFGPGDRTPPGPAAENGSTTLSGPTDNRQVSEVVLAER
jgi:hypothetical protein